MQRSKIGSGLIAMIVGLVVSGCTMIIPGTPEPGEIRRPTSAPPTATSAVIAAVSGLGELRSLDPCSLVDPAGTAGFSRTQGSGFNRCAVAPTTGKFLIRVDTDYQWAREASFAGLSVSTKLNQKIGKRGDQVDGRCDNVITLPGDIAIWISARATGAIAPEDAAALCPAASLVTDAVSNALTGGLVRHRQLDRMSLATVDGCAMLTKDEITAVLPGAPLDPVASPAGLGCLWGKAGDTAAPSLRYGTVVQPGPLSSTDQSGTSAPVVIARRAGLLVRAPATPGSVASCAAVTQGYAWQIPTAGDKGPNTLVHEIPNLALYGPAPLDQLCTQVQALAEKAWNRIPTS
jgi:hypothetical protein